MEVQRTDFFSDVRVSRPSAGSALLWRAGEDQEGLPSKASGPDGLPTKPGAEVNETKQVPDSTNRSTASQSETRRSVSLSSLRAPTVATTGGGTQTRNTAMPTTMTDIEERLERQRAQLRAEAEERRKLRQSHGDHVPVQQASVLYQEPFTPVLPQRRITGRAPSMMTREPIQRRRSPQETEGQGQPSGSSPLRATPVAVRRSRATSGLGATAAPVDGGRGESPATTPRGQGLQQGTVPPGTGASPDTERSPGSPRAQSQRAPSVPSPRRTGAVTGTRAAPTPSPTTTGAAGTISADGAYLRPNVSAGLAVRAARSGVGAAGTSRSAGGTSSQSTQSRQSYARTQASDTRRAQGPSAADQEAADRAAEAAADFRQAPRFNAGFSDLDLPDFNPEKLPVQRVTLPRKPEASSPSPRPNQLVNGPPSRMRAGAYEYDTQHRTYEPKTQWDIAFESCYDEHTAEVGRLTSLLEQFDAMVVARKQQVTSLFTSLRLVFPGEMPPIVT